MAAAHHAGDPWEDPGPFPGARCAHTREQQPRDARGVAFPSASRSRQLTFRFSKSPTEIREGIMAFPLEGNSERTGEQFVDEFVWRVMNEIVKVARFLSSVHPATHRGVIPRRRAFQRIVEQIMGYLAPQNVEEVQVVERIMEEVVCV